MRKNKKTNKIRKKSNYAALLLFLPLAIAVLFFVAHPHSALTAGTYESQENIPGASAKATDFITYMKQVIGFGYAVIGILARFMLCIGAYQYLMAAGNLSKAESAKNTIGSALLGLLLGLMSWVILYTINPDLVSMQGLSLTTLSFTSLGTTGTSTSTSTGETTFNSIAVSGTTKDRINSYESDIAAASQKYGVDESVIKAVIDVESSGNTYAKNPNSSASGLMQLTTAAAQDAGVTDVFNASDNINGGTKYLASMISQTGSVENGLAAYYTGIGNFNNAGGSWQNCNTATQNYVNTVMGKVESYK